MITIPHASIQTDTAYSKTELRYKKLLSSVDLTKDFFYSYTYPIMQSLQSNVQSNDSVGIHYDSRFVWNMYLTEPVRTRCKNNIWTVALVHGYFKQMRMSIFGRDFSVALVSRRSRHFAGTRYLKRGVNDRGRVANDVETEQIVLDEDAGSCKGKMSSVVQMRGSIPLFWSQEASRFSPKPDIILQRYDPTYEATKLHFEDLFERYGSPIIVFNLIKTVEKRPREMMLRREFTNAVMYLNEIFSEEKQLVFVHWDFHKFAKTRSANVLAVLARVASRVLDRTGFYYSGKPPVVKKRATQLNRTSTLSTRDPSMSDLRANSVALARSASTNEMLNSLNREQDSDAGKHARKEYLSSHKPRFQSGVLRTNCIDCLDRTNVAQYAYGLEALGRQLHAMQMSVKPKLDPDSSIATVLMEMYWNMGDVLAQQYGGSAAHNTVFPDKQGKWKATTQSREFLKSIKRYYSNTYTDGEKQDAINLFLGYFRPKEGKPALWELDSDYYLHLVGVGDDALSDKGTFSTEANPQGVKVSLEPVPACKEDFSRMKLTSFDKFIEKTCSYIKDVRLCCEPGQKPAGSAGASGVPLAPDAAKIQLSSPNWLYGLTKEEEEEEREEFAQKVDSDANTNGAAQDDSMSNGSCDFNWLSQEDDCNEEDIFQRYLTMSSVDEGNGWCVGTLLGDLDENSDIYKHYAQLCEGPGMELFENDLEKEQHYADVLHGSKIENIDEVSIEAEMEAALKEYDQVADDLGISIMCKSVAGDPSQLTRWIIGEEKLY
ncbi:unnamed protein product [Amaranthus hypochondriacus]